MTRKEFKAACKKAGACKDEFDRLIRAKTDAEFWGVALVNWTWCNSVGLGTVQDFVERGADVNAKDNDGVTVLMSSAWCGRKDIVEYLVTRGADVNAKDNDGRTALMSSAWWGRKDIVEHLVTHGADVNAKTKEGWTALTEAARWGYKNIVEYLKSKGANE